MKSRYVAFIVRIRFDEAEQGLKESAGLQGSLHEAGSTQMHPFDSFDRLVELLRSAIAGDETGNLDLLQ
jgi:hypothetical protein